MKNLQKKIQYLLNLYREKNLLKAQSFCNELISYYPNTVILYNILGLILADQEKFEEAISIYKKGIKIKPDYAMIYNNLASAYKSQEHDKEAESYYKKSIELNNKIPEPHNNLGNLYLSLNKYSEAIDCYNKAIKIKSNFPIFHYNLGIVYKNLGNFKESKKYLSEAIKLNKFFCIAHRNLSQLIKYTKNHEHLITLKELYENEKINKFQKIELAFALGKAYEDLKNYDESFFYYNEGNNLRRANITFSIKNEVKEFSIIKKIFNRELFNKFKESGSKDNTAIFILGMPRSGTTLVEQILSNHNDVFGGDELDFIPNLIKKHFTNESKELSLKKLSDLKNDDFKMLGNEYINRLRKISNKSKRITDKLPINFKWIGLIKLILPNSKIIHCTRNSRDNCFSIYKNYFVNPNLNFSYNLKEISDFYIHYHDLMKYWSNMFPNFIYDIKYEKITDESEKQIRNLINACDLSWSKKCLEFYNNKRPIKTASDTQVREKIYKSSVNIWKNYEKNLKDVFNNLPK